MLAREFLPGVYWVGAVDWDRRLFDALIPLPDGTSYNAYLVRGSEKAALIDTVDPTMAQMLHEALSELGISRLDYVVMNHAEQDHSGALPGILARYPAAKVLCTPKGADLAISLLHIAPERLQPVGDGEAISLGGRTLEFIHAPWVHWPETMLTYLREDKVLFPCDLFGSHLATSGLYATDHGRVAEAAKRYYAEIMMPFARNISRHLERLAHQELRLVAPSHGPMYDDPAFILDLYREWVDGPPRNKAVVAYISMHGSTRLLTEQLVAALAARGVQVERFDLSSVDLGKFAMALVDAATLLLGTPAVLAGPHPLVAGAATLVNALRPQLLFLGVYGSFGWGARLDQQVPSLLPNLRAELLPPVVIKGKPGPEELAQIDQLALEVAERHEQAKLRP
jgi:flavorubredoxin